MISAFRCRLSPKQGESLAHIKPEGNKLASIAFVIPHDLLIYLAYLKYVSASGTLDLCQKLPAFIVKSEVPL